MELKWNDAPVSGPIQFSKDVFDKYSLAPTIKDLWEILQSPDVKADVKEESTIRPDNPSSEPKPARSNITPQTRNSHGSAGSSFDCNNSVSDCKSNLAETKKNKGFPDPKVPYPRFSSLNYKDRKTYLHSLKKKKYKTPQKLIEKVKNEFAEFMKYLLEVSKECADDYKYIPIGANQYLEEYFKACLDFIEYYPKVYTIQEITSLSGGTFVSDISFNFEKQLLAMGTIEMVEKRILPEQAQLSVDYHSVSAVIPPLKKAARLHTPISSDTNAEKLSATYEPHVCLAKEAFLQLINSSAGYTEAWELPVWVKISGRGSRQSKTVYIDPPLLKTQMTWRERNHLIHEESVKLAYKKTGMNPVFFLLSEDYSNKVETAPDGKSSRTVVSYDNTGIDFEVEVTELESFGESCQLGKKVKALDKSKTPSNNQTGLTKPELGASTSKDFPSPLSSPTKRDQEDKSAKNDVENSPIKDTVTEEPVSNNSTIEANSDCPPSKRMRHSLVNNMDSVLNVDSDEDCLFIDCSDSPVKCITTNVQMTPPASENVTDTTMSAISDPTMSLSPSTLTKGVKKDAKRPRASGDNDQLGQILRMQNAMLKSAKAKSQQPPPDIKAPEPKVNSHKRSLVKPCVSAYLDSREGLDDEAAAPAISQPTAQSKRLLRAELLVSAEDERDYEAPPEASVLYKLYSLLDVLLMVRSTVEIAHPRHIEGNFMAVPVHVLPKLEYQLCYGAESLTHTEACQLWVEQLLHSNTVSFIGRINAHTSKVVELQELLPDWIQTTSCDFKPARSLNTLYHILKKVMSLQEGRYLLGQKPGEAFVTIFKAKDDKKPSRSVYDLQAVHCGPPLVPEELRTPCVPLDPFYLLPFHLKYNRPPCTFPPRTIPQPKAGCGKGAKKGITPARPTQRTQRSLGDSQVNTNKKTTSRSFKNKKKAVGNGD